MPILGILPEDRQPELHRGLDALRLTPASTTGTHQQPGIAAGVTDSSEIARLGDSFILLDARIDNRRELAADLNLDLNQPGMTTALLVLHAWQRWGDDLPNHLLGDFALAVWDGPNRRLLLARDPSGRRMLVFWHLGDQFRFASEHRGLLAATDVPMQLDETTVLHWLIMSRGTHTGSFFRNITILHPGHILVLHRNQTTLTDYFQPEKIPVRRIPGPPARAFREYADGLREVMDRAIHDRIAGFENAVGTNCSGGLDSSTVTALTAAQLAPLGHHLTSFTAVPAAPIQTEFFPWRFTDETAYAAAVADLYSNIRHVLIPNNSYPMFPSVDAAAAASGMPVLNPGNVIWSAAIHDQAKSLGLRLVMGGQAGNMTISWGGDGALTSLIDQRHYLQAFQLARTFHRQGQRIRSLVYESARPFLPDPLFHFLERRRGRSNPPSNATGLRLGFAEENGIGPDKYMRRWSRANGNEMRIFGMRRDDSGGRGYAQLRQFGLQTADPTSDRRVMEYCLTVPEQFFRFQGVRRSLIKTAMETRLPQIILTEGRKGLQAADFFTHLSLEKEEVAAELNRMRQIDLLARAIDFPTLDQLVANWPDKISGPEMHTAYSIRLTRALSIGRFVRRVNDGTLFNPTT